jgi:hypothetical protein
VIIKSTIFWDIMPSIPMKVNWRFGTAYRLHPHSWVIQTKLYEASSKLLYSGCLLHVGFLFCLIFSPEYRFMFLRNVCFYRTAWNYIPKDITLQDKLWQYKIMFSIIWIKAGTYMVKYSFISHIKVNIFLPTLYMGLVHIRSVVIGLVHFSNGSYNAVILMKIQSA